MSFPRLSFSGCAAPAACQHRCNRCGKTLADGAGAGRSCEPSPVEEVDVRTGRVTSTIHYCEID